MLWCFFNQSLLDGLPNDLVIVGPALDDFMEASNRAIRRSFRTFWVTSSRMRPIVSKTFSLPPGNDSIFFFRNATRTCLTTLVGTLPCFSHRNFTTSATSARYQVKE